MRMRMTGECSECGKGGEVIRVSGYERGIMSLVPGRIIGLNLCSRCVAGYIVDSIRKKRNLEARLKLG